MTQSQIIDFLLDLSPELKASYELYQTVIYAVKTNGFKRLEDQLLSPDKAISDYMKTAVSTLKKYRTILKKLSLVAIQMVFWKD